MRAHQDSVAMSYSFYQVITAKEDSPRPLRDLRHRCLNPGTYAQHLENWLDYYSPKQVQFTRGYQNSLHRPYVKYLACPVYAELTWVMLFVCVIRC